MTVNREDLERCIAELSMLLELPRVKEAECQAWLERHPLVFEIHGYRRSISHPELKTSSDLVFIPDFLVRRPDAVWEIFELKRPDTDVLRSSERRATFYSDMHSYISQCVEYSECCSDPRVAKAFWEVHGAALNAHPESTLVAGRSEGMDRFKVYALLKRLTPKIRHLTYDDLLEQLRQHLESNFAGSTEGAGLTLFVAVRLLPTSTPTECLLDVGGSPFKNRISVARYGASVLRFSVIDRNGLTSSQDVEASHYWDNGAFVCAIHVTQTSNSALVLFEINGQYVGEVRIPTELLEITHPLPYVLAADMEGGRCASVILADQVMRDPALTVLERCQLREFLFDKLFANGAGQSSEPLGLRFNGWQFMCTEGHPILDPDRVRTTNLVQREDLRRPRLSPWDPRRTPARGPVS